jgi:hypothetical protein
VVDVVLKHANPEVPRLLEPGTVLLSVDDHDRTIQIEVRVRSVEDNDDLLGVGAQCAVDGPTDVLLASGSGRDDDPDSQAQKTTGP